MPIKEKAKMTPVQKAASAMGRARWAKLNAQERSEIMKRARAMGGGAPRDEQRCYCGNRNWNSAVQRRFDCCKRAGKYPSGKALEAHKRKVEAHKVAGPQN